MKIGSLFSGCGGLDIGISRLFGAEVSWFSESDEEAAQVFAARFPAAERIPDVRTARDLPIVDVITAGFPCQDVSHAGRKAGIHRGEHSSLAHQAMRIIMEVGPRGVVLENSYHRWRSWVPELRRALWRGGYASLPLRVSATEVGAPHLRYRAFVVGWRAAADTDGAGLRLGAERLAWGLPEEVSRCWEAESEHVGEDGSAPVPSAWPPPPPLAALVDEPPPDLARSSQRLAGNAVVPRVAEVVGLTLARAMQDRPE